MRRLALTGLTLLLLAAPAARADHPEGRFVPEGVDQQVVSAHFVVHYDADTATLAAAQAFSADLEESHSRLVAGAGGTPNAGLQAPIPDADGRTDAYMSAPKDLEYQGGLVFRGDHASEASWIFMTPEQDRGGIRFRSAHEYMHVIQDGYSAAGSLLDESTANWASDFALPDIDPEDSNFGAPEVSLDCRTSACGSGYRQWPFMWRLGQLFGADVIDGLHDRIPGTCGASCDTVEDRQLLADEIAAQSGGAESLSGVFGDYARDIWVPTRWLSLAVSQLPTTALQAIHASSGLPKHTLFGGGTADTALQGVSVDRLAASYVLVRNDGGFEPSGPDDDLQITIDRPAGQTRPFRDLVWNADGSVSDHVAIDSEAAVTFAVDGDPAAVRQVLLPLVNDSYTDGLTFGYRVLRVRGTPTPPANDTPAGAVAIGRDAVATTDNVHAGGRGNVSEATGCPPAQDATRGVWFRFTPEGAGTHTVDATGSDFQPVVAVYNGGDGSFAGCTSAGKLSTFLRAGEPYDVYVGRWVNETGFGSQARLSVSGPGAVLPEVNVNTPADGVIVPTRTPLFSGNASNRFGDADTVRINLWAGPDPSGPPARTFTAPKAGTIWSVTGPELADGLYSWRAELDGRAGTALTRPYRFTVRGPAGGPGEVLDLPAPEFVAPECLRARAARTAARRKLAAAKRALKKAKGARKRKKARARLKVAQRRHRRAVVNVRRFCA